MAVGGLITDAGGAPYGFAYLVREETCSIAQFYTISGTELGVSAIAFSTTERDTFYGIGTGYTSSAVLFRVTEGRLFRTDLYNEH